MKLPESKIELAASTEASRYTLSAVQFDAESKKFIATDGHMLAVVPAEVTEGDTSALIGLDTLKSLRDIAKKSKGMATIKTNGAINCESVSGRMEFPLAEGTFPNWQAVLPKVEGPSTISFDAALLLKLAQAINPDATAKSARVTIWIKDKQSAISVKSGSGDGRGVLMPCRE